MTSQRTDLNCFVRTMVDHLYDSLKEAQLHPISRNVAVIEAQDGYRILTHKLARDDTPAEPKGIGLTIVLLLDDFFRNYPGIEDDATSKAFEQVVPDILDKLDIIKGLVDWCRPSNRKQHRPTLSVRRGLPASTVSSRAIRYIGPCSRLAVAELSNRKPNLGGNGSEQS